jgi:hypothetical protein
MSKTKTAAKSAKKTAAKKTAKPAAKKAAKPAAKAGKKAAPPAPAPKAKAPRSDKPIDSERETRNGVLHPAAGTVGGRLWDIMDKLREKLGEPPARFEFLEALTKANDKLREKGDKLFDLSSASFQYFNWRKFHGIPGRSLNKYPKRGTFELSVPVVKEPKRKAKEAAPEAPTPAAKKAATKTAKPAAKVPAKKTAPAAKKAAKKAPKAPAAGSPPAVSSRLAKASAAASVPDGGVVVIPPAPEGEA